MTRFQHDNFGDRRVLRVFDIVHPTIFLETPIYHRPRYVSPFHPFASRVPLYSRRIYHISHNLFARNIEKKNNTNKSHFSLSFFLSNEMRIKWKWRSMIWRRRKNKNREDKRRPVTGRIKFSAQLDSEIASATMISSLLLQFDRDAHAAIRGNYSSFRLGKSIKDTIVVASWSSQTVPSHFIALVLRPVHSRPIRSLVCIVSNSYIFNVVQINVTL